MFAACLLEVKKNLPVHFIEREGEDVGDISFLTIRSVELRCLLVADNDERAGVAFSERGIFERREWKFGNAVLCCRGEGEAGGLGTPGHGNKWEKRKVTRLL